MFTFAVDFDGTLVENAWPGMGDWLPGAVDALKELDKLGKVVIHTCRVAPAKFGTDEWRPAMETLDAILDVKEKLAEVGMKHLEVWTKPWKPPALVYIDDRGIRFDGDWHGVVAQVRAVMAEGLSVTMGGNVPLSKSEQKKAERAARKAGSR